MARVVKTPQISEFLLSPLIKPSHTQVPSKKENPLFSNNKGIKGQKLDFAALFEDCFYNVKFEEQTPKALSKNEEDFLSLFQPKKTIFKPKVFCPNPKSFKHRLWTQDPDFQTLLPELKRTSSSTSINSIKYEESKGESTSEFDDYKTPTMKPKRIPQQSSFQGFSKTEGRPIGFIFESFCPEVIESEKPRFLQEYELLENLGSGYFGHVFKCRNKKDMAVYAVKHVDNKGRGPIKKQRAWNEIQNMSKLNCSFTVKFYSSWLENDGVYILMEYCKSSLKTMKLERLATGFSEEELVKITKDLAMGLQEVHKNNIVHLDVKPENILIGFDSCYKLADFGLSHTILTPASDDITEGDARYMAKELLNEVFDPKELPKADLFSLGATIYELILCEELPCNGEEWHAIREGRLEKLERSNRVSEGFKGLVRGLMEKETNKRPCLEEVIRILEG